MNPSSQPARSGVMFGLSAYSLWGCFPLYFALFQGIPAAEVVLHRVVWSCVFLAIVVSVLRRWPAIRQAMANPKGLIWVAGCALLIALNWGVYIYAVETRHVLQASLGYFLTPLVNIALGMLLLQERITRLQAVSVALAATAIVYQLARLGDVPWIALMLALSFGGYGLMRKRVTLDGLTGLFAETLLLAPFSLVILAYLAVTNAGHFTDSRETALLLMSSGIVTAVPLLLFAGAARRLRLATIGFLMYINPTLQFLIGWSVFNEPLSSEQLFSFALVWCALAIYSWSAWQSRPSAASKPRRPLSPRP